METMTSLTPRDINHPEKKTLNGRADKAAEIPSQQDNCCQGDEEMIDGRLTAQRREVRNLPGDRSQQKTSTYIVPCFLLVEMNHTQRPFSQQTSWSVIAGEAQVELITEVMAPFQQLLQWYAPINNVISYTSLIGQNVCSVGTVLLAYYFEYTDTFPVHIQGFFCFDKAYSKPYPGPEENSKAPPVLVYSLITAIPTVTIMRRPGSLHHFFFTTPKEATNLAKGALKFKKKMQGGSRKNTTFRRKRGYEEVVTVYRRGVSRILIGEVTSFFVKTEGAQEKTIVTADCCYFNPLLRRIVRFLGVFSFGLFTTTIFANAGQVVTGNQTPHFLSTCKPNYTALGCQSPLQYISEHRACTGNPYLVASARKSFPSKDAALSFYSAIYTVMYVTLVFRTKGTRLTKPTLCLVLLSLAVLVGVLRVTEHRNHWNDILAGFVTGGAIAAFLVRKEIMDISSGKYGGGGDSGGSVAKAGETGGQGIKKMIRRLKEKNAESSVGLVWEWDKCLPRVESPLEKLSGFQVLPHQRSLDLPSECPPPCPAHPEGRHPLRRVKSTQLHSGHLEVPGPELGKRCAVGHSFRDRAGRRHGQERKREERRRGEERSGEESVDTIYGIWSGFFRGADRKVDKAVPSLKISLLTDLLLPHSNLIQSAGAKGMHTEEENEPSSWEERKRNWIGGGGPLCSGLDHGYSWVDNTDVDVIA
ncbi:Phospholipid phosphatase-related protein type 2 [Channa argus]|uniref:Phospholipid phosphatase-related protein type 2 n=1 Tax=Channa argus TaxID=215402 RepID=A0A6G1PBP1_CHAAH|nr:Phospholipid phosphatase-related protein type 2 [Channa argus]